ncbi:MAG: hypothetical protein M0Q91_15105 [Methanoregula sp.]|jgi:hypothetical protein|nr:hypothetical protein [Methanoregula sp.]
MNTPSEPSDKTEYSFSDMDEWIECARLWIRGTGTIPMSLWTAFDELVANNQRLSIYAHHRAMRYPSLKRAILRMQGDDNETACDDPVVIRLQSPRTPMTRTADRMFR